MSDERLDYADRDLPPAPGWWPNKVEMTRLFYQTFWLALTFVMAFLLLALFQR